MKKNHRKYRKFGPREVEQIYKTLQSSKELGHPRDYEIRINGITAIERTADLKHFYLFEPLVSNAAGEVSFHLYKGKSRVSDTIYFELENKSGEYVRELDEVQEKLRNKNRKIKTLRAKLSELARNEKQQLPQFVGQLLDGVKSLKAPEQESQELLPGLIGSDLLKMLLGARERFGEKHLHAVIGITLLIADNTQLTEQTKQFIINQNKQ